MTASKRIPFFAIVASDMFDNPKVAALSPAGKLVWIHALLRNASSGRTGFVSASNFSPAFMARQTGTSHQEAATGLAECIEVGLLGREGVGEVCILGWDEKWKRAALTEADRVRKAEYRDRKAHDPVPEEPEIRDQNKNKSKSKRVPGPVHGQVQDKDSATPPAGGSRARSKPKFTLAELESVRVVLEKLSKQNGVRYTGTDAHKQLIVNQLRLGVAEMDLRAVVGYVADELGWKNKPEMVGYLRPETLFGPKTISKYLDPARTWFEKLRLEAKPGRASGFERAEGAAA